MIIKDKKIIADTFNNYFADFTKTLKSKEHPNFDVSFYLVLLITSEIMKVIKIKEKYNTQKNSFSFTLFSKEDILKR